MNMPFLTMQALLGTDKRPPELPRRRQRTRTAHASHCRHAGRLENAEALRLLRAAGVQAVCGLAGYQPPAPTPPSPSPCLPEPRASVDKAAVIDVLRQVLSSGSDRMRLEAFRLMLGAGKVLPPALLLQALELGRRTPSLRGPIALIAGERGRWLGGRNAAWNLFATNAENELDPEVWDNGTLMQREAYLKSLRAQDPAKARERFETASASFRCPRTRRLYRVPRRRPERGGRSLSRNPCWKRIAARKCVKPPPPCSSACRKAAMSGAWANALPPASSSRRPGEGSSDVSPQPSPAPLLAVEPPESFDPEWKKGLAGRKKPQYEEFGPRAWWLYQIGRCVPLAVVGGAYRPVARSPHRLGAENRLAKRVAPQLAGGRPP